MGQQLNFTDEEIKAYKERSLSKELEPKLDDSNRIIAEFGILYGFAGVEAILNDRVDLDTVLWLIEGGRKVKAAETYNTASASFLAILSANSKKPDNAFRSNMKQFEEKAN